MRRLIATCTVYLIALISVPVHAEPPSNRVDPCAAVTGADLQKEFGTAFPNPRSADDGLFRHCSYADGGGRYYVYVDSSQGEESQMHNPLFGKIWLPGPTDLGVPAHVNKNTHELRIFKRDVVVTIRVGDHHNPLSEADQVAHETKLARIALSRM